MRAAVVTGSRRTLWGRADGLQQDGISNRLGTYTFNSIDDFAAGRPTSFSRTLSQPVRSGSVWNTAAAVSHQWAPTRFFSMLYGARVEADGFVDAPARNTALESALGVQTGARAVARARQPATRLLVHVQSRQGQRLGLELQNPVGHYLSHVTGVASRRHR